MTRLVVVGDTLLDRDMEGSVERFCPDAPVPVVDEPSVRSRPGGAGLAAVLAARDGADVVLVTALADDDAGDELRDLLAAAGVAVVDLGLTGRTPEKVRVRADGRSLLRLDYGGGLSSVGALTALPEGDAVLVADYGRGMTATASVREALGLSARVPVVWDPHPRGAEPVPGTRLATPNRSEAALFAGSAGDGLDQVTAQARALLERWQAANVAVTLGARGALLAQGDGPPLVVPPAATADGDACGAGDRFASAAALLLARGALPSEAVAGAVAAASAFVAAGGASGVRVETDGGGAEIDLRDPPSDPFALAERVRAAGGTVVATGGCFDLLHAGHVSVLETARRLGDCLIVCLNSDDSVRRLKGRDRPLQPVADRAAVLLALGCVDAVAVFDEDTPEAVLSRLRPHVFAKGADYSLATLPEAPLLSSWGGQAVVLPYLDGRSTTRLVEEARRARS
ncbi:MAG: D-glycero-beta-D-manno-heptose 1-phosphate adenylyltransferase [Actinobacteria bacterium]|nr:D-glycero-beta-D-manno-heptose 1-phosphate adenylyltransferase [Actinomycetota bacterium]